MLERTTSPAPCPNAAMKRVLQACSPHIHPYRWLVVNSMVLIWSLTLIIQIWTANYNNFANEDITEVEYEYLIYNFSVCFIWLVEVSFNVLDHKGYFEEVAEQLEFGEEGLLSQSTITGELRSTKSKNEVIAIYIELVLAVLFFIDSTSVALLHTRHEVHRQAEGMTFDVCINMLAYSYLIYRQYVDYRTTHNNNGNEQQLEEDTAEDNEEQVNREVV